ncbi:MAG: hypothetical protein HPY74_08130 [Firmicutes bacterium]|nr:hypothetical protein [Bacillota bacterium]
MKKMHPFKAEVKVFAERSADMGKILGQNAMIHCRRILVGPGAYADMVIDRN